MFDALPVASEGHHTKQQFFLLNIRSRLTSSEHEKISQIINTGVRMC